MRHQNFSGKDNDIFTQITNQIIKILEQHEKSGYQTPWIKLSCNEMPHNAHTKTVYRGFNPFILSFSAMEQGFSLNRWLTFLQVKELGGRIKKGSEATPIFFKDIVIFDKHGNKIKKSDFQNLPKDEKDHCRKKPFIVRYFVFNVAQAEGIGDAFYFAPDIEKMTEPELIDKAEEIINGTGAEIQWVEGSRAYYSPLNDYVSLPALKQFKSTELYYEVVFHELAHWTAHPTRLNRQKIFNEHKKDYAFEELIAEMSSAYTLASLGITMTISNNAEYVRSWLTCLHNDKTFVIKAGSQAEKATDFILNPVKKEEHEEAIS